MGRRGSREEEKWGDEEAGRGEKLIAPGEACKGRRQGGEVLAGCPGLNCGKSNDTK